MEPGVKPTLEYNTADVIYLWYVLIFTAEKPTLELKTPRPGTRKGLGCEIVPIFHTVFAHVYHYAMYLSSMQGLYHHNGVLRDVITKSISTTCT